MLSDLADRGLISPQVFDLARPEGLDLWVFAGAWSRLMRACALTGSASAMGQILLEKKESPRVV
jgi:hypothetical protein